MEWQERQLTASDDAWTPVVKDECSADCLWQVAHVQRRRNGPEGVLMRVLSPPASMCFVPSPWQVAQTALPAAPLVGGERSHAGGDYPRRIWPRRGSRRTRGRPPPSREPDWLEPGPPPAPAVSTARAAAAKAPCERCFTASTRYRAWTFATSRSAPVPWQVPQASTGTVGLFGKYAVLRNAWASDVAAVVAARAGGRRRAARREVVARRVDRLVRRRERKRVRGGVHVAGEAVPAVAGVQNLVEAGRGCRSCRRPCSPASAPRPCGCGGSCGRSGPTRRGPPSGPPAGGRGRCRSGCGR